MLRVLIAAPCLGVMPAMAQTPSQPHAALSAAGHGALSDAKARRDWDDHEKRVAELRRTWEERSRTTRDRPCTLC